MGKLVNGINGPFKGKIGKVVGSSRNGVDYVKGPYKERTKNISDDELASRDMFKVAQLWLKPLLSMVRIGFEHDGIGARGFVLAKGVLMRTAVERKDALPVINPALAKLSQGKLPLPEQLRVERINEDQLQISWNLATGDDRSKEQVMAVAYDVKNRRAFGVSYGAFRSTGKEVFRIFAKAPTTYHVYAFFVSADRKSKTDSVYLGEVVVGEPAVSL